MHCAMRKLETFETSHSAIVYDLTTGEIFHSNTEHLLYLFFFLLFSIFQTGKVLFKFYDPFKNFATLCMKLV